MFKQNFFALVNTFIKTFIKYYCQKTFPELFSTVKLRKYFDENERVDRTWHSLLNTLNRSFFGLKTLLTKELTETIASTSTVFSELIITM